MPTYEYKCQSCGRCFERLEPITARLTTSCPRCKGKARRLISSGTGLLFKGSGFYITDNRSSDYKKQAESDKPPSPPSAKPTSSKPKSKP